MKFIDRLIVPLTFSLIIGLGFLTLENTECAASSSNGPISYSRTDFPCSPHESWIYGSRVPEKTLDILSKQSHSKTDAIRTLIEGYKLQSLGQNQEAKNLALFIIYRSYLDIGLVHFAYRGFNSIANQVGTYEIDGIRLAALGCLNSIHHQYPSLRLSPRLIERFSGASITKMWPDQRKQLWEAVTTIAMRKLSELGSSADLQRELSLLSRSSHYLRLIQAVQASLPHSGGPTGTSADSQAGSAAGAPALPSPSTDSNQDLLSLSTSEKLLNNSDLPDSIENQKDAIQLNLARNYYNQKKFRKAIQAFNQVRKESNLYVQAIIGLAWSHLLLDHPSESVSAADNLIYGKLQHTFSPEAESIAAITLFENCHYPQAFQVIKTFRKIYDPSYQWLYRWYTNDFKTSSNRSLYNLLAQILSQKKSLGVPAHIFSEWLRSPVFIGWQQELNLLFDEQQIANALVRDLSDPNHHFDEEQSSNVKNQKRRLQIEQQIKRAIISFIQGFGKEIPGLQSNIIEAINHELSFINRYLISRWIDTYENIQLIQAEIYSATGESIIKKNPSAQQAENRFVSTQRDSDGLPVLEWGRFNAKPGDTKNDNEIWADEIGSLKTDISNLCEKAH